MPVDKANQRPIRWTIWALAMVLPALFGILIWQLWGLSPDRYCKIVTQTGEPIGSHCFQLLMEGLKIKGWTIWLLIGMMASFVLIVLTAAVKAVVGITGPGGVGLSITGNGQEDDHGVS